MSNTEAFNPNDEFSDDLSGGEGSQIGKTSREVDGGSSSADSEKPAGLIKRLFSSINLFDSLLLVSFILITFSTLYLIYAMNYYYGGGPWDKPWDVKL